MAMNSAAEKTSPWVKGPFVDLFCFGFGWLLIVGAFLIIDRSSFVKDGRWWILNLVLLTAVFHRHLTFPLVYGDRAQFEARRKSYIWLPIFFGGITLLGYLYFLPASLRSTAIAFPIQVTEPQSIGFRLSDSSGVKTLPVRFTQPISSHRELQEKFQQDLKGHVRVESDGNALRFTQDPASDRGKITVFREKSSKDFFESLGFGERAARSERASKPLLIGLVVLSVLWNFYHTLMQKMGILRVYSRKAGYGKSWLDKAMVWTWFTYLFFQIGSMPTVVQRISNLAMSGKYLIQTLAPFLKIFPYLAAIALAVALVVTALYLKEEWTQRTRIHWPKNLFMLSILMLYSLFFYDFFVAYVAFGFSHAVEYLAFVNIYGRRKYLHQPANSSVMARWIKHQGKSMAIFIVAMMVIFIPWNFYQAETLTAYILASSFLHFLYDGWIWKVRNPNVGKPLGIDYAAATPSAAPKLQTAS